MIENKPMTVEKLRKFLEGFWDHTIIDIGIRYKSENHVVDIKDIRVSHSENRITFFGETGVK